MSDMVSYFFSNYSTLLNLLVGVGIVITAAVYVVKFSSVWTVKFEREVSDEVKEAFKDAAAFRLVQLKVLADWGIVWLLVGLSYLIRLIDNASFTNDTSWYWRCYSAIVSWRSLRVILGDVASVLLLLIARRLFCSNESLSVDDYKEISGRMRRRWVGAMVLATLFVRSISAIVFYDPERLSEPWTIGWSVISISLLGVAAVIRFDTKRAWFLFAVCLLYGLFQPFSVAARIQQKQRSPIYVGLSSDRPLSELNADLCSHSERHLM
jgi:hypothetical protein